VFIVCIIGAAISRLHVHASRADRSGRQAERMLRGRRELMLDRRPLVLRQADPAHRVPGRARAQHDPVVELPDRTVADRDVVVALVAHPDTQPHALDRVPVQVQRDAAAPITSPSPEQPLRLFSTVVLAVISCPHWT
jgi:hypothetical protein